MAESLLNSRGAGRFRAFSAGSHPKGQVHPLALETLTRHHLPTEHLRSKSWNEFAGADVPPLHFIVTVCDRAAQEICPVWPGHPTTAHWSISDPAAVEGTEDDKRRAFEAVFRELENRIEVFSVNRA